VKRVNIVLCIVGSVGLLFFVYAAVTAGDPFDTAAKSPFWILLATMYLAGYLGEQIRRKQ